VTPGKLSSSSPLSERPSIPHGALKVGCGLNSTTFPNSNSNTVRYDLSFALRHRLRGMDGKPLALLITSQDEYSKTSDFSHFCRFQHWVLPYEGEEIDF
jgi:hypothetical protein